MFGPGHLDWHHGLEIFAFPGPYYFQCSGSMTQPSATKLLRFTVSRFSLPLALCLWAESWLSLTNCYWHTIFFILLFLDFKKWKINCSLVEVFYLFIYLFINLFIYKKTTLKPGFCQWFRCVSTLHLLENTFSKHEIHRHQVSNCAKDSDALEHNVFIHSIFPEEYNVWQLQMTNRDVLKMCCCKCFKNYSWQEERCCL